MAQPGMKVLTVTVSVRWWLWPSALALLWAAVAANSALSLVLGRQLHWDIGPAVDWLVDRAVVVR